MPVSNITLVKIGAIGGMATVSIGLLYRNKVGYNIRQTDFYKDALNTLRTHKGAVYLLGEPIKDRNVDISDVKTNFIRENTAQLKVPVKGTKKNGYLYFWAKKNETQNWNVVRMELELANDPDKRLLVKSEFPVKAD